MIHMDSYEPQTGPDSYGNLHLAAYEYAKAYCSNRVVISAIYNVYSEATHKRIAR